VSALHRAPAAPFAAKDFQQPASFDGGTTPRALLLVEQDSVAPQPAGILAGLTPAERQTVIALCQRRHLKRHDILFEQGRRNEGIYLIESGLIRVYCLAPSGREITRAFWYPGNFVGGPEIFGRGRHVWSARAVRKSEVLLLRGADLRRLVACMPNLALGVIESLIFKAKCYAAQFQMLGRCSAEQRLERLLDHLAELHGVQTDEGISIGLTLTHSDLAHLVGTTRQWISGALKRLEHKGAITVRRTYLLWHPADPASALQG
jgi:CRP/FNR family transcriptional regulator, cyclic AMP receptor protein